MQLSLALAQVFVQVPVLLAPLLKGAEAEGVWTLGDAPGLVGGVVHQHRLAWRALHQAALVGEDGFQRGSN